MRYQDKSIFPLPTDTDDDGIVAFSTAINCEMLIDAYSHGTRDLYYFALRLALVDASFEKEAPFLVLDDPFTHLDDARLREAKALVAALSRERQILYFTCAEERAPQLASPTV